MKFSLVQISVVVANIQVRILKTEVGKGFMRTAFDHELVDPKAKINLANKIIVTILFGFNLLILGDLVILKNYLLTSKGNNVKIH